MHFVSRVDCREAWCSSVADAPKECLVDDAFSFKGGLQRNLMFYGGWCMHKQEPSVDYAFCFKGGSGGLVAFVADCKQTWYSSMDDAETKNVRWIMHFVSREDSGWGVGHVRCGLQTNMMFFGGWCTNKKNLRWMMHFVSWGGSGLGGVGHVHCGYSKQTWCSSVGDAEAKRMFGRWCILFQGWIADKHDVLRWLTHFLSRVGCKETWCSTVDDACINKNLRWIMHFVSRGVRGGWSRSLRIANKHDILRWMTQKQKMFGGSCILFQGKTRVGGLVAFVVDCKQTWRSSVDDAQTKRIFGGWCTSFQGGLGRGGGLCTFVLGSGSDRFPTSRVSHFSVWPSFQQFSCFFEFVFVVFNIILQIAFMYGLCQKLWFLKNVSLQPRVQLTVSQLRGKIIINVAWIKIGLKCPEGK